MAKFIVYYQTVATIPVEVDIEVDHLGGRHFEYAIRAAAKIEFERINTRPCGSCVNNFELGEFEVGYDDDSIVRISR